MRAISARLSDPTGRETSTGRVVNEQPAVRVGYCRSSETLVRGRDMIRGFAVSQRPARRTVARLALWAGVALALVGCQIGCDGERARKTTGPKTIAHPSDAEQGATTRLPAPAGVLDIPA